MTFLEAALDILKREGRPLHFKELTDRAMTKKLLTFVGRTPEVTMQTQLTSAVKKAPGNPFVRVKPGVFGLLRYPEMPAEDREAKEREAKEREAKEKPAAKEAAKEGATSGSGRDNKRGAPESAEGGETDERGRRRRRRSGRSRTGKAADEKATETKVAAPAATEDTAERTDSGDDDGVEEPRAGGLSAAARSAALAETGVLEGDDDSLFADDDAAEPPAASGSPNEAGSGDDDDEGDDEGDGPTDAAAQTGAAGERTGGPAGATEGDEGSRRRRRRRRRRRGGEEESGTRPEGGRPQSVGENGDLAPRASSSEGSPDSGRGASDGGAPASDGSSGGEASSAAGEGAGDSQAARKVMTPLDAAIEILRAQPPGRGVHVRQLADSAIRRRLIHGEPNEAWRVIRTALAAEPKDRLRHGMRPRVKAAGSGLYALARRPPDAELEKAEQVFGEARRALRERTMAALERRLADLTPGAFEALMRVLLQREGFGPTTFVKRVEGTIYVEAFRGRGSRPSKCLIGLRPGGTPAGRRAIGELRAGIRARNHDEGVLLLAGRLADEGISEWKQPGPPVEIGDGAALAETCVRHGVGVVSASVNVDFVDADFFAELAEG